MQFAITVEEICRRLRPVLGKKIDLLYLKYKLSDSKEKKEEIEQALHALYEKNLHAGLLQEKILLEPPEKGVIKGTYPLGMVSYADQDLHEFGLNEKDWPRHVCITGMSGSGKTNFAFQILGNMIHRKKPFVVFDWKKSFRPLMKVSKDILTFTIGNDAICNWFRININRPPKGVGDKEWIGILCDIITEAYFASFGVHKMLSEVLDRAFEEFGVYKGSGNYPTWYQIKDRLEDMETDFERKRGRESEWLTSALRIAHSLTFGPFGKAICYKGSDAMTVDELLNKRIIFELHALNNSEKKFFCEFLLTYIYKMKKASDDTSTSDFKTMILVDEAHNIFLKDRPQFLKESITEMIYRDIREYGISLICLDQHISKLSDVVVGNSATNIAFQQMLPDDIECVSGLMQIRDYRKYFSMLPVGYAIVKLAERFYSPFLVKTPFIELKGSVVKDMDVKKRMEELFKDYKKIKSFEESCKLESLRDRLMGEKPKDAPKQKVVETPAEPVQKVVPPITNHLQRDLILFITQLLSFGYDLETIKNNLLKNGYRASDIRVAMRNVPLEKHAPVRLEPEQERFLAILKKEGPLPTTEVYNRIRLSPRKGNSIKDWLLEKRLIDVREERRHNCRVKNLVLTEKGAKLVASH